MIPPVERRRLAPGLEISRVLTGLWQIADMERARALDPDAAARAMIPYARAGLTTFDMADHYGSAEDIAGLFRARHQGDRGVQLLTKWVPDPTAHTREEARAAVQRSLDRLRVDRIDLLQFHAWRYCDPRWLDLMSWLRELREQGLVGHLGLTNFDAAHLRIVVHSGIEVVSNQVCYSLLDRRPRGALTELCLERGISLLAYGTVAGGFLTERWLGAPEPTESEAGTWSRLKYKRFIDQAGGWQAFQSLLNAVDRVARRYGVSMANVACRYVLDQPAVGGIIVGARLGESDHVDDNLRLFGFSLDEEANAELEAAASLLRPIPGNSGDEYRIPPFLTASGDLSHHVESFPPPYPVRHGSDGRSRVLSGTVWEDLAGFSRALRRGERICVSGTTATHGDRVVGGSDPAAQTHFVIDKIEGALESLGGRLDDVVRTRIFVRDEADWEPVARAHGERFAKVLPANTLVQAGLVGEEYLVEMEAEAVVEETVEGASER